MITFLLIVLAFGLLGFLISQGERAGQTPEELEQQRLLSMFGAVNPPLLCPHCQARGNVRTKAVTRKVGISGAKATGAILTSGVSLLATGLSRKEGATQARCDACGSLWHF